MYLNIVHCPLQSSLGFRYSRLRLSGEPLIQTTSHSELRCLGSSGRHPLRVKSIGWTIIEKIKRKDTHAYIHTEHPVIIVRCMCLQAAFNWIFMLFFQIQNPSNCQSTGDSTAGSLHELAGEPQRYNEPRPPKACMSPWHAKPCEVYLSEVDVHGVLQELGGLHGPLLDGQHPDRLHAGLQLDHAGVLVLPWKKVTPTHGSVSRSLLPRTCMSVLIGQECSDMTARSDDL